MHRIFLGLMALIIMVPAAMAALPDHKLRLTAQINDMFSEFKESAHEHGWRLTQTAPPQWRSDREIIIPAFTFHDAENTQTKIPDMSFFALKDGDRDWILNATPSFAATSHLADGKSAYELGVTGGTLSATWNTALRHLSYLKLEGATLNFADQRQNITFTLNRVTIQASLAQIKDTVWSGPIQGSTESITITSRHLPAPLTLPRATWTATLNSSNVEVARGPDEILGTISGGTLTLTGLDRVFQELQLGMATAPDSLKDDYLKAIIFVNALNGTGKPVDGDAGSKAYDIVFQEDGQVTINGVNISALLTLGGSKQDKKS